MDLVDKGNCSYRLVLAGRKGWKIDKILADIPEKYKKLITFTGFVDDIDLPQIYKHAEIFIFPSLYEGFGMPLIEAMSAGIPIVCSNRASLPEIAGDAALFFDPYNVDEMADAINIIIADEKTRETLIRRGQDRLRYFSDRDSMINEYIEEFEKYMSD